MSNTLQHLIKVHDVDREIAKLERALADVPRRIADRQEVLDKAIAKVEKKKQQITETQQEMDRLDLDVKSREENIAKMQVQLNGVKTNLEYQTLTTQIESAKADNGRVEEDILVFMDKVEDLRKERVGVEEELAAAEKQFQEAKARLEGGRRDPGRARRVEGQARGRARRGPGRYPRHVRQDPQEDRRVGDGGGQGSDLPRVSHVTHDA